MRINDILKRVGIIINSNANNDIALALKVKPTTTSTWKKRNTVALKTLSEFCQKQDIDIFWLLTGKGSPKPSGDEEPEGAPRTHSAESTTSEFDDYTFIPQMNDGISAGPGIVSYNLSDIRVAFRKDWIKRKGDPKDMSLIKVIGDSMEPTLLEDDLVLVNHGKTKIDSNGGIYALTIGEVTTIKRVQLILPQNNILKIISDNPRYDIMTSPVNETVIHGRVIWYGREIA